MLLISLFLKAVVEFPTTSSTSRQSNSNNHDLPIEEKNKRKNQMKPEFKELVERRAIEGKTAKSIKKELDQIHGHAVVPGLSSISTWIARFKASARGKDYVTNLKVNRGVDIKYRTFIENGVNEGKSKAEIQEELWAKYGKKSVSPNTIRNWFFQFKEASQFSLQHNVN